ncbi:MAG TPA: hypothetical protein VN238_20200 [Solirubrobacteraceae bacterium]|nr:hypothetical protein [Solirubrobacteraceae bacterium]
MAAARSGLSAAQLLEVVDAGGDGTNADRGRIMLAAAAPSLDEAALDAVSLGARDAWIVALRCGTLGETLLSRVTCPSCGMLLTVRVPRAHVGLVDPSESVAPPAVVRVSAGAWEVEGRAPDGVALAAAAACFDVELARMSLVRSCVVSCSYEGSAVDPLAAPDELLEALGEAIIEAEPMTEVRVPMACAACGLEWRPVLDIALFAWRELSRAGEQLLDEVHQLAMGYGWTEAQVLELSSRRRRRYVERLTDG